MIADKNRLLDILSQYNIVEINADDTHYEKGIFHLTLNERIENDHTFNFDKFVFAFNRVLLFYRDIIDYTAR